MKKFFRAKKAVDDITHHTVLLTILLLILIGFLTYVITSLVTYFLVNISTNNQMSFLPAILFAAFFCSLNTNLKLENFFVACQNSNDNFNWQNILEIFFEYIYSLVPVITFIAIFLLTINHMKQLKSDSDLRITELIIFLVIGGQYLYKYKKYRM